MTLGGDGQRRFDLSGSGAVKQPFSRVDRQPGKVVAKRASHELRGSRRSCHKKSYPEKQQGMPREYLT